MFSILGELLTLAFIQAFGTKSDRREVSEALEANNRELKALLSHHVTGGICLDRWLTEVNEKLYPDYRKQLNKQRTALGLPPM
jgi:hypothetical protein